MVGGTVNYLTIQTFMSLSGSRLKKVRLRSPYLKDGLRHWASSTHVVVHDSIAGNRGGVAQSTGVTAMMVHDINRRQLMVHSIYGMCELHAQAQREQVEDSLAPRNNYTHEVKLRTKYVS